MVDELESNLKARVIFKDHIKKHKMKYVVLGSIILTAGITCLIMRKNPELLRGSGSELLRGSDARSFNFFTKINGNNVTKAVTSIHTGKRGNSGFVTRCLETGELFSSQRTAASTFDIPESILSSHLNGKFPDACGYHFERIGVLS